MNLALQCPWVALQQLPPGGHHGQSNNPWHICGVQSSPAVPHCQLCCKGEIRNIQGNENGCIFTYNRKDTSAITACLKYWKIYILLLVQICTYKWKVSLYFGDQLLDFDLVACFRFLSARCGPMRFTSTNGRNIPVTVGHLRSFAATTARKYMSTYYWNSLLASLEEHWCQILWSVMGETVQLLGLVRSEHIAHVVKTVQYI